jgi:hypothetical protein
MNEMLNTYLSILDLLSGNKEHYSPDTKLTDLVNENFDYIDFLLSVVSLETTYRISMPKDISDDLSITVKEFIDRMRNLPKENDDMFVTKQIIKLAGYLEQLIVNQEEIEDQEDNGSEKI